MIASLDQGGDGATKDKKKEEERSARVFLAKCRELGIDRRDDQILSDVVWSVTTNYIVQGQWGNLAEDHQNAVIRKALGWRERDQIRRGSRNREVSGDEGLFESLVTTATQFARIENQELAEQLESIIAGLPLEDQLILDDFRNGIPPSKTAEKLSLDPSAVGMRRLRTLLRLREELKEQ